MTTEMLLNRYKEVRTHFDSSYGPVNLSGIAHDLQGYIDNAAAEAVRQGVTRTNVSARKLTDLNKELRKALDDVNQRAMSGLMDNGRSGRLPTTSERNRDPEVQRIVGKMHDMAFATKHLDQVANQPLFGLVIDYMAQLAWYSQADPDHLTRRAEMSKKLNERIRELEYPYLVEASNE